MNGWKNSATWNAFTELSNTYWMYEGVKQLMSESKTPKQLAEKLIIRYGQSKAIDYQEIAEAFFENYKEKK